jgi:putative restriction endonuclease
MAFGEIPGNPPGTPYDSYEQMVDAGVHRQNYVGIVGGARDGVESIVLNGGYADDQVSGDEVIYTGFGGQDTPRGRQVRDQEWVRANEGLLVSMARGEPVRVIRGSRGDPTYSPATGYRYDGLYAVVDTWQQPSRDGPLICRARLVRTDSAPVPTRPDAEPQPIPRVPSTVMRQVRDTAMANAVKALHNYTCQVCGDRLVLPGGAAYAEGAHIRPLGTPHNRPDVKENVLCLCPNDHVGFDHGAIYLTNKLAVIDGGSGVEVGRLRLAKGHLIDLGSAAFDRGLFGH